MATYGQWARGRKASRVAWVCGEEAVLARGVSLAYRQALPEAVPRAAWADHPGTWDALLTAPAWPQLTVVWSAEHLKRLDPLPLLLGDEFDGSYFVFVSTEGDFRRDGKNLVPALAALRDSRHGQIVRCCPPAGEEDRAAIVAGWWPGAGRNVAAALLERCGGSLTAAWHAADKAVRAGIAPDARAVPTLCPAAPGDDFAGLLVRGDRRAAMGAARALSPDAAGMVIARLASRLQLIPVARDAVARREQPAETVRRLRLRDDDVWALRQLRPAAGDYAPERLERCRELLAVAETAWRSGARDGVLEAIAALW